MSFLKRNPGLEAIRLLSDWKARRRARALCPPSSTSSNSSFINVKPFLVVRPGECGAREGEEEEDMKAAAEAWSSSENAVVSVPAEPLVVMASSVPLGKLPVGVASLRW